MYDPPIEQLVKNRTLARIPREQVDLLNRTLSWSDGSRTAPVNVPPKVLADLKEHQDRQNGLRTSPSAANTRAPPTAETPNESSAHTKIPRPAADVSPQTSEITWPSSPMRPPPARAVSGPQPPIASSPPPPLPSLKLVPMKRHLDQPLPSSVSEQEDLDMTVPRGASTASQPVNRNGVAAPPAAPSQTLKHTPTSAQPIIQCSIDPKALQDARPTKKGRKAGSMDVSARNGALDNEVSVSARGLGGRDGSTGHIASPLAEAPRESTTRYSESLVPPFTPARLPPGPIGQLRDSSPDLGTSAEDIIIASSMDIEERFRRPEEPVDCEPEIKQEREAGDDGNAQTLSDSSARPQILRPPAANANEDRASEYSNDDISESSYPFEVYKTHYPDYPGTLEKFLLACMCLEYYYNEGTFPSFLFDDFIRAYVKGWEPYMLKPGNSERVPRADQWYVWRGSIKPQYFSALVTRENLKHVLEMYHDEVGQLRQKIADVQTPTRDTTPATPSVHSREGSHRIGTGPRRDASSAAQVSHEDSRGRERVGLRTSKQSGRSSTPFEHSPASRLRNEVVAADIEPIILISDNSEVESSPRGDKSRSRISVLSRPSTATSGLGQKRTLPNGASRSDVSTSRASYSAPVEKSIQANDRRREIPQFRKPAPPEPISSSFAPVPGDHSTQTHSSTRKSTFGRASLTQAVPSSRSRLELGFAVSNSQKRKRQSGGPSFLDEPLGKAWQGSQSIQKPGQSKK